ALTNRKMVAPPRTLRRAWVRGRGRAAQQARALRRPVQLRIIGRRNPPHLGRVLRPRRRSLPQGRPLRQRAVPIPPVLPVNPLPALATRGPRSRRPQAGLSATFWLWSAVAWRYFLRFWFGSCGVPPPLNAMRSKATAPSPTPWFAKS